VRLIDENGEMIGIISLSEALQRSRDVGVDLVEVTATSDPPICKIIDYGKLLYDQKKKERQQKKNQKTQELKGIRLSMGIGGADLDRQRKHAEEFITEGRTVRIQMVLRGRENAHKDLAVEKVQHFIESLGENIKIDQPPKWGNRQIVSIIKPK